MNRVDYLWELVVCWWSCCDLNHLVGIVYDFFWCMWASVSVIGFFCICTDVVQWFRVDLCFGFFGMS